MTDLWIEGIEHATSGSGRTGQLPRQPLAPPRGVVHTSETGAGSIDFLLQNLLWPYHIFADPVKRRAVQVIPLNKTAYSLRAYDDHKQPLPYETNHMGSFCVQVCIVGKAAEIRRLTGDQLLWLADTVFGPIVELTGIPNVWDDPVPAGYNGWVLASVNSPLRKDPWAWGSFTGWTHHQMVPGQDHWDPGDLDVQTIQSRITSMQNQSGGGIELPDFGGDPVGNVDSCKWLGNGVVELTGWARDPNDLNAHISVHVWRGSTAESAKPGVEGAVFAGGAAAAGPREEQVGTHGFVLRLTGQPQGQFYRVYALNLPDTPGANVELSSSPVEAEDVTDPEDASRQQALVHIRHAQAALVEAERALET